MKVEIRSYAQDRVNGVLHETWTLKEGGQAVCDDPDEQRQAERVGITGRHGRLYHPKDGEEFLRNLPWEYAGSSFIRAVVIE